MKRRSSGHTAHTCVSVSLASRWAFNKDPFFCGAAAPGAAVELVGPALPDLVTEAAQRAISARRVVGPSHVSLNPG